MAAQQWWYQRREPVREYLEEEAREPTAASPQDVQMEQIEGTVNPGFDIWPLSINAEFKNILSSLQHFMKDCIDMVVFNLYKEQTFKWFQNILTI